MGIARVRGEGKMGTCSMGISFQLYKVNEFKRSLYIVVHMVNNSVVHT